MKHLGPYVPQRGTFAEAAINYMLRNAPGTALTTRQLTTATLCTASNPAKVLEPAITAGLVEELVPPTVPVRAWRLTAEAWKRFGAARCVHPEPSRRDASRGARNSLPASFDPDDYPSATPELPPPPHQAAHVRGPQHGRALSTVRNDIERADGQAHRQLPSRRGNTLVYRDGREVLIEQDAPQAQRPQRRLSQWDLEQIARGEGRREAA